MKNEDFNWKRFQEHNLYTDEELKILKKDPRKSRGIEKLFSREVAKKYYIVEVVRSHGCTAGMRVGDRLIFRALGVLVPEKSSPWCAQAMGEIGGFANMVQDRFVSGLDPNDMIFDHFSCLDAGVRCGGWGQVIMRAYVVDESELGR
jgi:uncharacterized repeat protein (TIGR04076 family)